MKSKKMKEAVKGVSKTNEEYITRLVSEKCRDFVCQSLAIMCTEQRNEYGHTTEWIKRFVENFFHTCDMVDCGYGTGKQFDGYDMVKEWKDIGIDIMAMYDASHVGYQSMEERNKKRGESK